MISSAPMGESTQPRASSTRLRQVDPLRVLRVYARLLIVCAVVGCALGFGVWFGLKQTQPGYTSQAKLSVSPPVTKPFSMAMQDIDANRLDANIFINNEIQRLMSENVMHDALDQEMVRNTGWFKQFYMGPDAKGKPIYDIAAAQEELQTKVLEATPIRGTTIFSIAATTNSAEDAQRVLEAVTEAYLRSVQASTNNKDEALRRVMIQERDRLEEESRNLSASIVRFAREKDLVGVQERNDVVTVRFEALSRQKVALEVAQLGASENYRSLLAKREANHFEPTPDEMMQIENHPEVSAFTSRINVLREQRDASARQYGPEYPAVKTLDHRIAASEAERDRVMQRKLQDLQGYKMEQAASTVESIRSQMVSIEKELEQASNQMASLAEVTQDYKQLQDQSALASDRIARINEQLDDMRVVRNRPDSAVVRMMASPTPGQLSFPQFVSTVGIVSLMFLGVAAGLVFFKEMLDQRIKSPADLMMMSHIDVLGVLPDTSEDPAGQRVVEGIVQKQPSGLMAESYRQIRTGLLRRMDRDGHKTLALTGPQAGTGVSCALQNLATSLAFNGRNVLIVDANFRRPSQHKLAQIANDRGLVDVLRSDATLDQVIHKLDGLSVSVLPTGNVNAAAPELIETETFRHIVEELRARYDIVLFDAPPALITSDAQMLARTVDAFALVSRAETDTRGMIQRMMRQLDGQRASLLGVILNGVRGTHGGYFRRSYQDFYSYHQETQKAKA